MKYLFRIFNRGFDEGLAVLNPIKIFFSVHASQTLKYVVKHLMKNTDRYYHFYIKYGGKDKETYNIHILDAFVFMVSFCE